MRTIDLTEYDHWHYIEELKAEGWSTDDARAIVDAVWARRAPPVNCSAEPAPKQPMLGPDYTVQAPNYEVPSHLAGVNDGTLLAFVEAGRVLKGVGTDCFDLAKLLEAYLSYGDGLGCEMAGDGRARWFDALLENVVQSAPHLEFRARQAEQAIGLLRKNLTLAGVDITPTVPPM
jgi:hypothetical protein